MIWAVAAWPGSKVSTVPISKVLAGPSFPGCPWGMPRLSTGFSGVPESSAVAGWSGSRVSTWPISRAGVAPVLPVCPWGMPRLSFCAGDSPVILAVAGWSAGRVSTVPISRTFGGPAGPTGTGRSLSWYEWLLKSQRSQYPFEPGTGGWAFNSFMSFSACIHSVGRVGHCPAPDKDRELYAVMTFVCRTWSPLVPRSWR